MCYFLVFWIESSKTVASDVQAIKISTRIKTINFGANNVVLSKQKVQIFAPIGQFAIFNNFQNDPINILEVYQLKLVTLFE